MKYEKQRISSAALHRISCSCVGALSSVSLFRCIFSFGTFFSGLFAFTQLFFQTLYAVILVVSLITDTFLMSVAFVILLMCLRRYSGVFHCKTAEICLLVSFLMYLLAIFGYEFVSFISNMVYGISTVLSSVIVLIFSPVEDKNRPLDETEKVLYRQKAMIALCIILALEFAALIFEFRALSYLSACSLTANAVLILISQIRRCKNEIIISESSCEDH